MPQPRIIGIWLILSMLAVVWENVPSRVDAPLIRTETAAAQAPGLTPASLKLGLPTGKTSFANVDVVIAQEAGFFTQQGTGRHALQFRLGREGSAGGGRQRGRDRWSQY